jgi:hypothetical protein
MSRSLCQIAKYQGCILNGLGKHFQTLLQVCSLKLLLLKLLISYNRESINPLKTEGILRNFCILRNFLKSERSSKIMVPRESLSQYLSNEYQSYGVAIVVKYQYFFHSDLILVTKVDL